MFDAAHALLVAVCADKVRALGLPQQCMLVVFIRVLRGECYLQNGVGLCQNRVGFYQNQVFFSVVQYKGPRRVVRERLAHPIVQPMYMPGCHRVIQHLLEQAYLIAERCCRALFFQYYIGTLSRSATPSTMTIQQV